MAIPLLKPDVFIDGAEAQEATLRLLRDILVNLPPASVSPPPSSPAPKLVLRTYLQERSEFRASIFNGAASEEVKRYYRMKWLPRRFWVTELSKLDLYETVPAGAQVRVGEVLLDAAAEAEDGAFLSIRLGEQILPGEAMGLGGVIVDRNARDGAIQAFPIQGGFASPLVRPTT